MCTDKGKENSHTVSQVPSSQHLLPGLVDGRLGQSQEVGQKVPGISWGWVVEGLQPGAREGWVSPSGFTKGRCQGVCKAHQDAGLHGPLI